VITDIWYQNDMTEIEIYCSPLVEDSPRDRILKAAEEIIANSGVDAATTRSVAIAANVQAPTIYRLFGDKDGLLDAVAEKVMAGYATAKTSRARQADPVNELREGWNAHVAFALTHPGIFQIVSTRAYPATTSPALVRGIEVLRSKINAVASVGRLRITEARAIELFHATATGVILLMLRCPPNERDMALSEEAREATITALTGEAVTDVSTGTPGVASALLSRLPDIKCLSHGERLLLTELLDRIVVSGERTCVAHFPTEGPLK
jgi:AcrR family transcriptional regulator